MAEELRDGPAIWHQKHIPVIYRRAKGEPLLVRLPYAPDNYSWLASNGHRNPKWKKQHGGYWETPYAWLNILVRRIIERYGRLYLIQPIKVLDKCAPACWKATGFECHCSCMGENHGSQSGAGWYTVSETFACRWTDSGRRACRLLVRPSPKPARGVKLPKVETVEASGSRSTGVLTQLPPRGPRAGPPR